MMPNVDTEAIARMIFEMSPADRAKVTQELGMTDGPERPRTTRTRPPEQPSPGVPYRIRRVRLT